MLERAATFLLKKSLNFFWQLSFIVQYLIYGHFIKLGQ